MVETKRTLPAARERAGAARSPRRAGGPHQPSQCRAGGERLFPPALPHPGDEEHAPHDLHQDRLVVPRSEGSARHHPGIDRSAPSKLIVFGAIKEYRRSAILLHCSGRSAMPMILVAGLMLAQAPLAAQSVQPAQGIQITAKPKSKKVCRFTE